MKIEDVILVEDDRDHAALIQMALVAREPPLRIRLADSGEKALEMIDRMIQNENEQIPKLFLIDINLPGINGIEVLRRIKSERKLRGVPVVMLTTSRASNDISRSYEAYANSYVIKPTSYEGIKKTMTELQSYWTELNIS